MKSLLLFAPLVALSVTAIAQRPIDMAQPASTQTAQDAPREALYTTNDKRNATPPTPHHDWKQTIAENNSALATRACLDMQQYSMPVVHDRNTSGTQVSPRRFHTDIDGVFYYSGTPYTWKRSHSRKIDTACGLGYLRASDIGHTGDPAFELAACLTYFNFYTPLPYESDIPYKRYFAYAHDGYIVYKGDTIPGVVTVTDDRVTVENLDNRGQQKQHVSLLDNLLLRDIVVYNQLKELHMRRPTKNDTRLWRVLHHGKLNIYDKRYRFISAKNIDPRSLRIQYGTASLHRVRSKGQLVAAINRTYQLKLRADKYSWEELFNILEGLS